jgi:class 3 adenylate cyclase
MRVSVHASQPAEVVIRHAAIHIGREFWLQAIQRFSYEVWGNAVNVAQRLEEVSQETTRLS